jgi:hypothetical protein
LLPDSLSDRQQDGAEPLLAIADAAGGDWPSQGRAALIELCTGSAATDESVGVRLLADIRDLFRKRDVDQLASREMVNELLRIEGSPWAGLGRSEPMTPNSLARLLAPFDIAPRDLRFGASVVKGYRRNGFSDGWNRYLPPDSGAPVSGTATPLQVPEEPGERQLGRRPPESDVAAAERSQSAILRTL